MVSQALAAVAALVSFAPHGNRIEFRLDRGAAEMVWVSPSTFRFRRVLEGALPTVEWKDRAPVSVQIDDQPGLVRVRSKFLDVAVQKRGLLLRVRRPDGTALMADLSEPVASVGGVVWDRQMTAGTRYYGLGPRAEDLFDARGKAIDAEAPFLSTTAGYGEYHPAPGKFRFDFTASDRYRVQAPAVDYFFYYGPGIKQIFEEHKEVRGTAPSWPVSEAAPSWNTLRTSLHRLVQGAMSAALGPTLSLKPYENADPELQQRARQLGSLVDDVSPGKLGLSGFRRQLEMFYTVYASEAQTKGYPIWHPLPFQFPEDPECARHVDEFMLGDEMLVAPIVESGTKRPVYLPQGMWTNLETNERVGGRRTITVDTKALPVFARNGTIIPLDSGAGLALHYFPTLAAEFFLLESDPEDWTQIHAAPAADILRLEIESKKARDYEWVVHHVEKPVEVGFEERKYRQAASIRTLTNGSWFYDAAQKTLQVRVHVNAGEDCIVNLSF